MALGGFSISLAVCGCSTIHGRSDAGSHSMTHAPYPYYVINLMTSSEPLQRASVQRGGRERTQPKRRSAGRVPAVLRLLQASVGSA